MSSRYKLFHKSNPYAVKKTQSLFICAIKENVWFHYHHCQDYKRILDEKKFNPHTIETHEDLIRLPFIPTLYFKHHQLMSIPEKKMIIKATSSGTSGKVSKIGLDWNSFWCGFWMVFNLARVHHFWSLKPVHYLIFGYRPTKQNQTAISKSANGFTYFTPVISRTYALEWKNGQYQQNLDLMKKALIKYEKSHFPVRTAGFPAYTYFLLKSMKEEGIRLHMPKGSIISIGGGWKNFQHEQVDKNVFYALAKEVLDIEEDHIVEFFSAVEHPILYMTCQHHHFHIPIYSRVIIRNPDTFEEVPHGEVGLVNLITPMLKSNPIVSVMTDDLGILHDEPCPCGNPSPWLEIISRVGVKDIITCAVGAQEYLKK
ncbi:MAG: acyl-protein synthetase [Bacilli bacterium]|nr:acyl-protein synthetase [Bacilli bacterium]